MMKELLSRKSIPAVLFILLIILSFFLIKPFFLALFLGALLAYISYPLYRFLKSKIKNKTVSALIICVLVLLILVVPAIFLLKVLIQESYVLYIVVKQKLALGLFTNCQFPICNTLSELAKDPEIHYHIQEAVKTVTNLIAKKGSAVLLSLPRIILNLFVILFSLFYFLVDGEKFVKEIGVYFDISRDKFALILQRLKEIVNGVVFGYLLVAFIQGALGALGFFIFGISSPLFWGLVMAFLALIPILGTGFVWLPASLYLFLEGIFQNSNSMMLKGVGLFLYSLIFVASLDNIIRPKLMGEKAKIHPAFILLGILGGLFMFGPLGVILGPLILSLLVVIIESYFNKM